MCFRPTWIYNEDILYLACSKRLRYFLPTRDRSHTIWSLDRAFLSLKQIQMTNADGLGSVLHPISYSESSFVFFGKCLFLVKRIPWRKGISGSTIVMKFPYSFVNVKVSVKIRQKKGSVTSLQAHYTKLYVLPEALLEAMNILEEPKAVRNHGVSLPRSDRTLRIV